MRRLISSTILACGIAACGEGHASSVDSAHADSVARVRQDSVNLATPGYVIDSILPVEEELRRFRVSVPDTLRNFEGGATSRDDLVRSFARALAVSDTASLVRLAVSRAEFAWLIYPDSPLSKPPYRQAPALAWMRHAAASGTGLERLLDRLGGSSFGLQSWACHEGPVAEDANRIWRDCALKFEHGAMGQQTLRLFSSIIERQGRFKILSFANGF